MLEMFFVRFAGVVMRNLHDPRRKINIRFAKNRRAACRCIGNARNFCSGFHHGRINHAAGPYKRRCDDARDNDNRQKIFAFHDGIFVEPTAKVIPKSWFFEVLVKMFLLRLITILHAVLFCVLRPGIFA